MQVASNHLVRFTDVAEIPAGYEVVPDNLARAANAVLRGANEATVSRHSGGQLSKWAAGKRRERRRMAKESRRRNPLHETPTRAQGFTYHAGRRQAPITALSGAVEEVRRRADSPKLP